MFGIMGHMDRLQPPEDAYGRVTDPDRYRPLHAVADRIVEELTATHDVEIVPADPGSFGSTGQIDVVRVVELVPADPEAATLAIAYTDFPGLMVRVGQWHVDAFPSCGCDACHEHPDEVERDLRWLVRTVTRGGSAESLSGRWYGVELVGEAGVRRSKQKLSREETRRRRPSGRRSWGAWPNREDHSRAT